MLTFNETLRLTSFVPNLSRLIAQLLCYRGSCRKSATNFTNKNSECRKKTFSKKVSRLPSRFDKTTKNFSNINIKTLLTFTNIFSHFCLIFLTKTFLLIVRAHFHQPGFPSYRPPLTTITQLTNVHQIDIIKLLPSLSSSPPTPCIGKPFIFTHLGLCFPDVVVR